MPNPDQTTPWPSLRGLWGLLWRSVVLLPVAILLYTAWFLFWASVLVLPFVALISLALGDWLYALGLFALWVPLFFLSRWKKLRINSKDTLNPDIGNI
jgi:membrane protein implicated in regulation of membrane protease activity